MTDGKSSIFVIQNYLKDSAAKVRDVDTAAGVHNADHGADT